MPISHDLIPPDINEHPPETLVHNGLCKVSACSHCGVVQLMLQYLTLRFDEAAFSQLVATLVLAEKKQEARRQAQAAGSIQPSKSADSAQTEGLHTQRLPTHLH
ncbi:hypothetical protein [Parvibium lacunae]|uniref:Uncharacterized protein n=1 Tax=Parvibium lacunae TaxID=1888893 RepID=A0A368L5F3_9BURK|nr:hypothetical protein [Parvibium lacunae]RCS58370.1 hypothetical protein DU000_06005 [Parvibium lacunae]